MRPLSCPRVPAYLTQKARQSAKLARHHHAQRGEYLGSVEAPKEKAAEVAAVTEFGLSEDQRHRLTISPNSK